MNQLSRNNANTIKKFLKELLPPFIIKKLRLRGNIRGISRVFSVYENYESAMKDASGYEDKILTKETFKSENVSPSINSDLTSSKIFFSKLRNSSILLKFPFMNVCCATFYKYVVFCLIL